MQYTWQLALGACACILHKTLYIHYTQLFEVNLQQVDRNIAVGRQT